RSLNAVYVCPADPNMVTLDTGGYPVYKANYMVNWGNATYDQASPYTPSYNPFTGPYPAPYSTVTFGGAPFALDMSYGVQNIIDGTSNTLLVSEVKIAVPNGTNQDHRGDVFNDDYNCTMFMAYTTPNSLIPDYVQSYCQNGYQMNPPCISKSPPFN